MADFPIRDDGTENSGHHYSWTYILEPMRKLPPEVVNEVCILCFKRYKRFAKQLAHARDEKGREALGIVSSMVRKTMLQYLLFLGNILFIYYFL
jgi:hypothetical protein